MAFRRHVFGRPPQRSSSREIAEVTGDTVEGWMLVRLRPSAILDLPSGIPLWHPRRDDPRTRTRLCGGGRRLGRCHNGAVNALRRRRQPQVLSLGDENDCVGFSRSSRTAGCVRRLERHSRGDTDDQTSTGFSAPHVSPKLSLCAAWQSKFQPTPANTLPSARSCDFKYLRRKTEKPRSRRRVLANRPGVKHEQSRQ